MLLAERPRSVGEPAVLTGLRERDVVARYRATIASWWVPPSPTSPAASGSTSR